MCSGRLGCQGIHFFKKHQPQTNPKKTQKYEVTERELYALGPSFLQKTSTTNFPKNPEEKNTKNRLFFPFFADLFAYTAAKNPKNIKNGSNAEFFKYTDDQNSKNAQKREVSFCATFWSNVLAQCKRII